MICKQSTVKMEVIVYHMQGDLKEVYEKWDDLLSMYPPKQYGTHAKGQPSKDLKGIYHLTVVRFA